MLLVSFKHRPIYEFYGIIHRNYFVLKVERYLHAQKLIHDRIKHNNLALGLAMLFIKQGLISVPLYHLKLNKNILIHFVDF